MNLYKATKQATFTVHSVPNVELLENLGVRVGTKIELMRRYALGGPVLLRVEDACVVALGKDVAVQIEVMELTAKEVQPA